MRSKAKPAEEVAMLPWLPARLSFAILLLATLEAAHANPIRPVKPMPHGRAFHGACVLGNHLYVVGGASYGGRDFSQIINIDELVTLVAPILPGGDLGDWRTTTPLPAPRHYLSTATVVLNDVVYLVGGTDEVEDGKRHTTILMNRAQADGSLGQWEETATFPHTGLSFTTAFSTPGWLHMVAGVTSERQLSAKTWSVEVKPDGHLGKWREGPPLPTPLWFHQAAVSGGRVFIFGGLETYPKPTVLGANVFVAPLLGDGTIGAWQRSAPLPKPFYGGVASSTGPYIMSFMGRYSGGSDGENTDVWWTVAGPNGLDTWKKTTTNVFLRRHHAVASDYRNSSFYVVGGKPGIDAGGTSLAYLFSLTPAGRAFAERGWSGGTETAGSTETTESSLLVAGLPPATPVTSRSIAGLPNFFLPYQIATPYDDSGKTRPMVMYFMAGGSKPSQEQNARLAESGLEAASRRATFATVDVTATPQVAQQRGVFRVPTWLFFDSRGNLVDRKTGMLSAAELSERVNALR